MSQRGLKKNSKTNALRFTRSSKQDRGGGGPGRGVEDPSLLYSADSGHGDAEYEELTDLEGQKGLQTERERLEGLTGK